jgi:hypothetical protein
MPAAQPDTASAPQPPPVHEPKHPLDQLTTWELRDYRNDLEHALAALPAQTPTRAQLTTRLAAVVAEQDDRARLATHA